MSFDLGFIGGGNMSTAIFMGILKNDTHPASRIWVSGPHPENLKHWSEKGATVTYKNEEVFKNCDIVFLGVKPGMLQNALRNVGDTLAQRLKTRIQDLLVISMLAGVSLDSVEKTFHAMLKPDSDELNKIFFARIMPNVPMSVGSGTCLYSSNCLGPRYEDAIKLLESCGNCETVPESLLDPLGVLTACGPAYIFMVIEALADGAVKQGVPRAIALRSAAQMVMGSADVVLKTKKHPAQLKDEVCSPGGSTICGVSVLEDGKLRSTLINALEASTVRTQKLDPKSGNSK